MNCFHCKKQIYTNSDWYFFLPLADIMYMHYNCFADFAGTDFVNRWGEFPNNCLICHEFISIKDILNRPTMGVLYTATYTIKNGEQCIHPTCLKEAAGL